MIDPREIIDLINSRVARVLTLSQACLREENFPAFRKLVLDEFGRSGLETEIYMLVEQNGKRNG